MSKFCGKCGSKLDEKTGLCPNCGEISKRRKKKSGKKKLVVITIISLVVVISALFLLTYFRIIDIPFVSSILSSMGINNSNNESDITFQNFDEEDIAFDEGELYVKSQLLITANDSFTYEDVKKAVRNYGGNIVGAIKLTNDYQIEFDNKNYDELNDIAENLKKYLIGSDIGLHKVFYIEEYASSNNSKDEINGDWWRDAISLNALEQKEISYSKVNVGIFDTVFDTSNKDLTGVFKSEWQNYDVVKSQDHGTSVAGFISAKKNNDYGIDGISDNSNIYGFSFNGNNFYKYPTSVMKYKYAIALMLNSDSKILNFSNGYEEMHVGAQNGLKQASEDLEEFSGSLADFLKKYLHNGYDFLITKAAGNQNNKTWIKCDISKDYTYGVKNYDKSTDGDLSNYTKLPDTVYTAEYDIFGAITDEEVKKHIIIVGAAESHGYKLTYYPVDFSVRGERVDIYAPGQNLKCLIPKSDDGSSTTIAGGTSFSAPIVAGVASLVWGANPDLAAIDVRNAILNTASLNISGENKKMIDAYFAVNYALQIKNVKDKPDKSTGVVMGAVKVKDEESDIYASFADISFTKKEISKDTKIQADKDGLFDVMLDSGDYVISVSLDGYNTFTKEISVKDDDVIYIDDIFLSEENSYVVGNNLIYVNDKYIYSNKYAILFKESPNDEADTLMQIRNTGHIMSNGDTVFVSSSSGLANEYKSCNIYSVKTDVSGNKKLFTSKGKIQFITFYDNCIYYLDRKAYDEVVLSKYDLNSGKIVSFDKSDLNIDNNSYIMDAVYIGEKLYLEIADENSSYGDYEIKEFSLSDTSTKTFLNNSSIIHNNAQNDVICFCSSSLSNNDWYIYTVDKSNKLTKSAKVPSNLTLRQGVINSDSSYAFMMNTEENDFDLYKFDMETGSISTIKDGAGGFKNKGSGLRFDQNNRENIYLVGSGNAIQKFTGDGYETYQVDGEYDPYMCWVIDGYVINRDFAWCQIKNKEENVKGNSGGTIVENDGWKQAYIEHINEICEKSNSIKDNAKYCLVYIDSDNIPELVTDYGSGAMGSEVCTYDGSTIKNVQYGQSGVSYLEKQNLFYFTGGHMDVYFDYIYSIENGDFTLVSKGEYGAVNNSQLQFDNDGTPIYRYIWGGVETDEKEYKKSLKAVFDTDSAIKVYLDGQRYDYDEIISVINRHS